MKKVLIVDDSTTMRQILIRSLGQLECEFDFEEAADGIEALEKMSRLAFDVVLCDINMPRMDGVSLIRSVRKPDDDAQSEDRGQGRATSCEVPILVVTTEGGSSRIDEALHAGASAHLRKPFTPDQLSERLALFL